MALKISKPGGEEQQALSLCIYGRGGVGKTTLLGTMPGKGLVVDIPQIEGGDFVLADHGDRIDVTKVREWNDIEHVFNFLSKEKHDYAWVAIDSLTAMQVLARKKTVKERTLSADPHVLSLPEYGKINTLIGELVYQFKTLPVHVIWICQERLHMFEDEGVETTVVGPDIRPGALGELMPSMILVGQLFVYESGGHWLRGLRVGTSSGHYTKVRAKPGKDVPQIIAKPHLGKLLKYMLGSGERPEEARPDEIVFEEDEE